MKEHIKLLGRNFTNNQLYNPAFPMLSSPFLHKFFGRHPDTGKFLLAHCVMLQLVQVQDKSILLREELASVWMTSEELVKEWR